MTRRRVSICDKELNLFARKWGKDTFIVPLIAWFTGMEKEPNAWCQIVAENEKQSKRTFDIVRAEVECRLMPYSKEKYIE